MRENQIWINVVADFGMYPSKRRSASYFPGQVAREFAESLDLLTADEGLRTAKCPVSTHLRRTCGGRRMTQMGHAPASRPTQASDRKGSRPCENVCEPRKRRIVFSIAFFGQPSPELLVFRLTKSRRTFYAQIERGSFRTASVDSGRSAIGSKTAAVGGDLPFRIYPAREALVS
jgi:hypothetical protein